jgi:hypothetical protein
MLRFPGGFIAAILIGSLTIAYICTLSIQVIAVHKNFRLELAWGPLSNIKVSDTTGIRSNGAESVLERSKTRISDIQQPRVEIVKQQAKKTRGASNIDAAKENQQTPRPINKQLNTTRTLPPHHHRAPGFIIIGAQKAGTQALRTYMSIHPNVVTTYKQPETHFFDKAYQPLDSPRKNLETYLQSHFSRDCRNNAWDCISGESTPFYLYDTNHVPKRIKKTCPWTKFIVMLRDPVKRAFSQCSMLIDKNEIEGRNFEQHLQWDLNRMIQVGLVSNRTLSPVEEDLAWARYQDHRRWRKAMIGRGFFEYQLRKWFEYFPREQFLIIDSQDLDHDRNATLQRVNEFLGLPDFDLPIRGNKIHRRKYKNEMLDNVRDFLYEFYEPYNKRLAQLLGPEWDKKWEKPETS